MKKADIYDENFLKENMMGPNSILILEEMLENINLKKGMRILDLGCGKGLTSIYLAKEYDAEVYAVDLWTNPTENYNRFIKMGLKDKIIPLCFDVLQMPFADDFFDGVISVDSYHYFGNNDTYFDNFIKPIVKKDGVVAIALPSIKKDFEFKNIPEEMKPFWDEEAFYMWMSKNWWENILKKHLDDFKIKELDCFEKAWNDWLSIENKYTIKDKKMLEADKGRYMNIISITGKVK